MGGKFRWGSHRTARRSACQRRREPAIRVVEKYVDVCIASCRDTDVADPVVPVEPACARPMSIGAVAMSRPSPRRTPMDPTRPGLCPARTASESRDTRPFGVRVEQRLLSGAQSGAGGMPCLEVTRVDRVDSRSEKCQAHDASSKRGLFSMTCSNHTSARVRDCP